MKCYTHQNKDAVGQCSSCNKGVCSVCAVDINGKLYCKDCTAAGKAASQTPNVSAATDASPPNAPTAGRKSPVIAALLSFVFLGAGQVYNGELGKFVMLWAVSIIISLVSFVLMFLLVGFFTIFLVVLVWLYGVYDAYKSAKKINKRNGYPE